MTPHQLQVLADHLRDVMPEADAADVVKWAANPEAVRELLGHTPTIGPLGDDDEPIAMCARCGVAEGEAHRVVRFGPILNRPCPIPTAWRALGDPRGAADIERAHEEAKRQRGMRFPRGPSLNPLREPVLAAMTTPQAVERAFRSASESQQAAQARFAERYPAAWQQHIALCDRNRATSDARGMEAVKLEARQQNAAKMLAAPIRDAIAAMFPPTL